MPHLSDASPKNCSLLSLQYRCKYIVSISSLLMQFAALQQPYRTARPESCPSPPLAAGFKLTAAGFKLTAAAAAIRGAVHPSLPPTGGGGGGQRRRTRPHRRRQPLPASSWCGCCKRQCRRRRQTIGLLPMSRHCRPRRRRLPLPQHGAPGATSPLQGSAD